MVSRSLGKLHLPIPLLALTLFWGMLAGQGPDPVNHPTDKPPEFYAQTFANLREVRVMAPEGELVRGLTERDFVVREKGQARPIRYFEERNSFPVTVAFLIDTGSNMSQESVGIAKQMVLNLVHLLEPRDEILLATYERDVHFLTRLTRDREELVNGIWNVAAIGRKGKLARLGTLFASSAYTGEAIDYTLIEFKKFATSSDRFVVVVSAGFGNIGMATLDHLKLAGARFIGVSFGNKLGDIFGLGGDQTARKKIVQSTGGLSFAGSDVLKRIDHLRDAIKHHYLIAFDSADPERAVEDDELEFEVPGRAGHQVHWVRRTRSESSAIY